MATSFSTSTIFKGVDRMSPVFDRMSRRTTMFGSVLKGVLGANIIQSGFQKLKTGMSSFIVEASKMEDVTAAFTPLMGGVERATSLVDALNKTAATTPFQFENISTAAKQLLPVMNQDIEKTISTFRMLGDTAGGNAQKLDSITRGFTKSMLKGKVDMESLNMIAEAGVPIYTELSKSMGVTVQEMMDMSRAGTISSDDLTNAFKAMTTEGGIFFNGMEIASKTLTGRLSTLSDNIKLTAAALGKNLLPILKPFVDEMIKIAGIAREWATANEDLIKTKLDNFIQTVTDILTQTIVVIKKMLPVMKMLSVVFLSYKLAVIGVIVAQKALIVIMAISKFIRFIKIIALLVKWKGAWAAIQWVVNAAMTANPIGLITVGIAALSLAIIFLVKNWDTVVSVLAKVGTAVLNVWDKLRGFLTLVSGAALPLLMMIETLRSLITNFNNIKTAFSDGGFLAGIKAIGSAILEGIVSPLLAAWEAIIKMKNLAVGIGGGIKDIAIGVGGGIKDFFTGDKEAPNQAEANSFFPTFNQTINASAGVDIESTTSVNGAPAIRRGEIQ